MELEAAKKILKKLESIDNDTAKNFNEGLRYYLNKNDITDKKPRFNDQKSPLRRADNKISSNFHQLLVDQKVNYLASVKPDLDLGKDELNKQLTDQLGSSFDNVLQQLSINASLGGVGWLHVWHSEKEKQFKYAVVKTNQIQAIYNNDMERDLLAVVRSYKNIDEDGKEYTYTEYWTKKDVSYFKHTSSIDSLTVDNRITVRPDEYLDETERVNIVDHDFGRVPFIFFNNNSMQTADLIRYKGLIDAYDAVYNGFMNDLEDIQQVILILKGYEGTELEDFWDMIKSQVVKLGDDNDAPGSGLDKLTIDIPVEARNTFLDRTFDDIFVKGQGVNPTKLELGNNSGVAIKMLYTQLELKASQHEAQFRPALERLVKFAMMNQVADVEQLKLEQTWHRASINNELEKADIIAKLATVTSEETIAKANPLVTDWKQELKDLASESTDDDYKIKTI